MNNPNRLSQLLVALEMELGGARAGSDQGQFPILDLVGNLRDEAATDPERAALQQLCAAAWEKTVCIVESGQPFTPEHVTWLHEFFAQVEAQCGKSPSAAATPAVETRPAPPPPPPAPAPAACLEDQPLNLNLAEDTDLLREFINESREHLDNIEQGVLVLEEHPDNAETLNTIFRAFHTFKGGAGFLNLVPINRLAHTLESLLDLARQGKLAIDRSVIDVILRGRDVLKQFLDEIESQINGSKPVMPILIPTEALKAEARAISEGTAPSVSPPAEAKPAEAQAVIATPATEAPPAVAAHSEVPAGPAPAPATKPAEAPAATATNANANAASAMVKVDTGKLDGLLDLVGELVIAQSLVAQNLQEIAGVGQQFTRNMAQMGRITRELQRVGMSLRMVPIRGVFQKMARVARDLSVKQQKKVQFLTVGEDTELDRGVGEELNDPLLHMIRNSMDHGIEPPSVRVAHGKLPVGTLQLRAYHQGGNIVVEIQDDGAGLNKDRILKKAIERGLASPNATLTDEEVYAFVFAAGFSTAEKVTDLSGRGVGLDVVRRNIEHLRGRVDISSTPGKGTQFKLTLPLTLAIIDGLIIKVGEERFILPTLSVCESFRPRPEMISRVQGRAEVVNVRGRLIPLLRLYEFLGITPKSTEPTESLVVVVQSGTSFRCLLVDALLHKQEVVIKNLNDMMTHKNRALAGATILGDGRVGLILDVNNLIHQESSVCAKAA
jgi:two-component system chemotaxis sensor kinase CheA